MLDGKRSTGRIGSIPLAFVAVALVLAACRAASTTAEPSRLPAPGTLLPTPTIAATPAAASAAATPTPEPTPLPLPAHDLAAPQVWFGPNMGSVDFPELFSQPDRWATAREAVDVFAFYANTVSGDPYDIGGDNVLDTFVAVDAFAKLHEWGIPIVIEAGAVKFFACDHASWAEYANRAIDNVEAHGGRVSFVAMDEPLLGGQLVENGMSCGYTMEETAVEVAAFVAAVTAEYPDVRVGTIETSPPQTPDEIAAWLLALEAAGAKPAFLHLDVEIADGIANPAFVAALRNLRDFSEARGIPFGLILTADWQVATSEEAYFQSVLEWAESIRAGMGRPSHGILQSWIGPAPSGRHEMPINLPDDAADVFSHTRLILEAIKVLGSAGDA